MLGESNRAERGQTIIDKVLYQMEKELAIQRVRKAI